MLTGIGLIAATIASALLTPSLRGVGLFRVRNRSGNTRAEKQKRCVVGNPDAASMWRLSAMLQAFAGAAVAETGGRSLPVSEIS
ncbi:hypothetical protein ACE102_07300 [Bradyrhizobium sp. vgs-9]|uniref:hypothetical protein n=1 Tax=Bradyrhizobium sp. vgs-9 TaxID=208389 RepID=UPI0035D403FD